MIVCLIKISLINNYKSFIDKYYILISFKMNEKDVQMGDSSQSKKIIATNIQNYNNDINTNSNQAINNSNQIQNNNNQIQNNQFQNNNNQIQNNNQFQNNNNNQNAPMDNNNNVNDRLMTKEELIKIIRETFGSFIASPEVLKFVADNVTKINEDKIMNIEGVNDNERIKQINKIRDLACIKEMKLIKCNVCNSVEHLTRECPNVYCKICFSKGHIASNCKYKPILCQFCGIDMNPNNNSKEKNKNYHSWAEVCPKKKVIIAKRNIKCSFCHKWGHLACNCFMRNKFNRNKNNTSYNRNKFNQFKNSYNNFNRNFGKK